MRKRVHLAILAFVFVVTAGACGPALSPKAKATMILSTYTTMVKQTAKEADDCLARGTACTEPERENIRAKKVKLVQLDKLVKPIGIIIEKGGVPDLKDEDEIYSLIDDLTTLGL